MQSQADFMQVAYGVRHMFHIIAIDVAFSSVELTKAHVYDTVTEGPEYEVVKGEERKAKEEFALKECPAYIPVTAPGGGAGGVAPAGMPMTAPGGGAGEGVLNSDGGVYETLS